MGKKTSIKRKSLANAKETPNKIRKTNTSTSKNKSNKSSIKNNGAKITPKREKLTKQIEEDESDESDNSMDELNDNLHDTINSDNEIEEDDTDEKEDIDNDDSDDANSDDNTLSNEAVSDKGTMGKKTSTKRKSLANAEETSNKIRKTNTSASKNKSNKSTIKNNGTKITPKREKLTKQIDEDESDESDNPMDELNGTNDNLLDAINSDNEIEEDDTDEKEAIDNDDSDDTNSNTDENEDIDKDDSNDANSDTDDKDDANSSDKAQTNEAVSDKEKRFSVSVTGLNRTTPVRKIFKDCNILNVELTKNPVTNEPNGHAIVFFEDKKSQEKALEKHHKEYNGRGITVTLPKRRDLSVYVKGMKPRTRITDIFNDCNIDKFKICRDKLTNKQTGRAFVTFKDEESVTKALKKDGTRFNEYVLTLKPAVKFEKKRTEFKAFVKNLNYDTKLEDLFKDCKINLINISRDPITNRSNGMAFVYFQDEESLQKALLKHKTEYDGRVITVVRDGYSVFVTNLNVESKFEDVFKDCNIQLINKIIDKRVNQYTGSAIVNFKDNESLKKALSKNETEFDGNILYVSARNPRDSKNSADWKNKRENNYKGYATSNYKDKEYLKKSKTEFNGKTRNAEFGYNKYKQRHSENSDYVKPTESSCNPESKIEFLKKQLLLEELKLKTQKLEQEIYEQQKSLNT